MYSISQWKSCLINNKKFNFNLEKHEKVPLGKIDWFCFFFSHLFSQKYVKSLILILKSKCLLFMNTGKLTKTFFFIIFHKSWYY